MRHSYKPACGKLSANMSVSQFAAFALGISMLAIGAGTFADQRPVPKLWCRGMLNSAAFLISLSLFSIWLAPLSALLIPAMVVGGGFLLLFFVMAR